MYFDLEYYWRFLRHVWSLKAWPRRNKLLFRLVVLVPIGTLFHGFCFLLDYVFFPRLWTQKVDKPVFIVGHARSGSTLTHRLLAADGDTFSYFLYWETFFPSLLQKRFIRLLGQIDARCFNLIIKSKFEAWDEKTFGRYRHIHDMSLWNSEEDQFIMRGAFLTQQWSLEVPMAKDFDLFYISNLPEKKRRRWMHHYRECVKRQLLLNGGDRTHLSKNPIMSGWVDALIDTFPDARIGVVMRDPRECIPSVLKLLEVTWRGKGWREDDYQEALRKMTEISLDSFLLPRQALTNNPLTPQIVIDYNELTKQPRSTIQAIYKAFNLPISLSFDSYLREQEQKERNHKPGFKYSLDDYELSKERIESDLHEFFIAHKWDNPKEEKIGGTP